MSVMKSVMSRPGGLLRYLEYHAILDFFLGDKDFIPLEGTGIRMVAAVAILPREIRYEKKGVED